MAAKQTDVRADVLIAEHTKKYRRVITGHDAKGEAIFIEDEICPNRFACGGIPTFVTNEIWKIDNVPSSNEGDGRDPATVFELNPPQNGNVFRIVEFPPDTDLGVDENGNPNPPLLHRTVSLDFCYVIEGEVYAILDKQEKLLKAGDILIQRGTNHAWSNRSNKPCYALYVINGAKELPDLPPR